MELISVIRVSAQQYVNTVLKLITMDVVRVNVKSHVRATFVRSAVNVLLPKIPNASLIQDYVNRSPFVNLTYFIQTHVVSF